MQKFLGLVREGRFSHLNPGKGYPPSVRVTEVAPQESVPPDSKEIDLSEHEGRAILISGDGQGEWIYSASVVEVASEILTFVVQQMLIRR
jgi:hypothetical protein